MIYPRISRKEEKKTQIFHPTLNLKRGKTIGGRGTAIIGNGKCNIKIKIGELGLCRNYVGPWKFLPS